MADKIPVNVKKDYRVKKPTGMAKEMREAGEGMGKMKASPRLQAKMDAVKRHRDEHEGGHTPGFPLGRRSTSDGYMPHRKEVTMGGSMKGKKEFNEALGEFAKNPKLKKVVDYRKGGMDAKPGKIERAKGRNSQKE